MIVIQSRETFIPISVNPVCMLTPGTKFSATERSLIASPQLY